MGMFIVILLQNDVGKLLLILSCANRKFDNLMLSANFKISHLLYKGLTDGGSLSIKTWERCINFSNSIPILIISECVCVN